jgi:uncharacterized protein involved in exopolysaccharide biosynthesis
MQNLDANARKQDEIQVPVSELVVALWRRRLWLTMISGFGFLLSICIALSIPNEYKSTAQLMPPDHQTLSGLSMLDPFSEASAAAAAMGGSLLETATPGGTLEGVLRSRTSEDDIVNRFNLLSVYHCKYSSEARSNLAGNTIFTEDKQSGIITISVTDVDKYRALKLTEAYIEELDKLLSLVNTSSAHRERLFLGERLKSLKSDLDSTSAQLSQFSSRNATMNPQSQGQALIEAAARLQAELITAQSELNGLRARYSDDNMSVREVRARVDELQGQLRKMRGAGEKGNDATLNANQFSPSMSELPILGVTYTNIYRQLTMQEALYETLSKQYELAKVEEAKEIPIVKVLDEPALAETKSSPHRTLIVLLLTLFAAFAGTVWIIARRLWEIVGDANPIKTFGLSILHALRAKGATSTE